MARRPAGRTSESAPTLGASPRSGKDRGKDPLAAELGRRGGLKGGKARAAKLSPEQRREIAQRAAALRWAKQRAVPSDGPALPGLPHAVRRGTLRLGGHPHEVFVLADGRRVVGLLSFAAALVDGTPHDLAQRLAQLGLEPDLEERALTFSIPGDWRLARALDDAALVDLCAWLAGQGRDDVPLCRRALAILADVAVHGLRPGVDAVVEDLPTPPS